MLDGLVAPPALVQFEWRDWSGPAHNRWTPASQPLFAATSGRDTDLAVRPIAISFAVLAAAVVCAPPSPARTIGCGTVIRADTVLDSDIGRCRDAALEVGADGVTLDLGGHSVRGAIVARGRRDLRIADGTVVGDVILENVKRASVRRLRVRRGSIECLRSAGCAIAANVLTGGGIVVDRSAIGVPNRVRGNLVSGAQSAAITVSRSDTTQVTRNVARASELGIVLGHAADLLIARNRISGSAETGLTGYFGTSAVIVDNLISGNGGDGISLRTWGGETQIARNVAIRNRGSGISGSFVAHWRVAGNVASLNGATGIVIGGSVDQATLIANRAERNGGLGIDAAPGVLDGGANRAFLNGAPAQCAGIACR
jgi:parallel beta-helix repeat protein